MKRIDNPELTRRILKGIAEKYHIFEAREPNHLSTFITCRTKGFFDQKQALEPTDTEVLYFVTGYGLQDMLTPADATAELHEFEGIVYRPDMTFVVDGVEQLQETKTTRRSAKYHYIDEDIPVTWLEYMKGGCKIRGTNTYDLTVLYIVSAAIYSDTFIFEEDEIEDNWKNIKERKEVLDKALADGVPPTPYQNCWDWECKNCRYKMMCEVMSSTGIGL